MAAVLTGNVLVRRSGDGALCLLLEGSQLPDWAVGLVGEHALTGGRSGRKDPEQPGSRAQAASAAASSVRDAASTVAAAAPVVAGGAPDGPPPQSGPGSGRGAWAKYATAHGVTVGSGDSRDDIVAACEKAGVPTGS